MVKVDYDERFKRLFQKIKDPSLKERILKQIEKIKINPEIGKPMMNVRKGTRELRIKPFRLAYAFLRQEDKILILDLYHKKFQ